MSQRQCDKCGEMVDADRAFCPGCGQPLVEEKKRQSTSEFESLDHTQQIGQTMYNRMLSDMGLNISKQPKTQQKPSDTTSSTPQPPAQQKSKTLAPAATVPTGKQRPYVKWIAVAAGAILILALVVVAAAATVVWLLGRT